VNLYVYAIENENLSGVYNAVAPNPVNNKSLMQTIGAALNRNYVCLKVPEFALKIVLGEMSTEVLKSATVSSSKIEGEGFEFKFRNIEEAVNELVN
jgi:NAD dependent epimerase/dehydratase family enzyme